MTVAEAAPSRTLTESRIARASAAHLPERPLTRKIEALWDRVLRARPAPRAIDAAHHELDIALIGRLGYYVDAHAQGRPIVLIHDLDPWASAFEVRPLFEAFRGERPVYAPDLPGFGTSERAPSTYRPILFTKAIKRLVIDVVSPREEPVDLVAIGASCELCARLALEAPELVHTIAMIAPTGLGRARPRMAPARRLERALSFPLWAAPIYRAMSLRPIVAYAAQRRFGGKVPRAFVECAVRSARAPGAHRAAWALLSRAIETPDAFAALYERLQVPTLVMYDGSQGMDPRRAHDLERRNPAVRTLEIRGTKGMPHFERRDEVIRGIRELHDETRRGEEADARA